MKIHKLLIQDIRGIRAPIEFLPGGRNLIICGQNGTGKSAVVDALDFLFSGKISRIEGEGTGKILINQHGKNITQDDPAQAFVEAEIEVPGCNNHISLRRSFDRKNQLDYDEKYQPIIEPLLNFASHEHHLLSRKKILDLIISTPGHRASKISALMNLSEFESFRKNIMGLRNQTKKSLEDKQSAFNTQKSDLGDLINNPEITEEIIFLFVNEKRAILGAENADRLDSDSITRGLTQVSGDGTSRVTIPNFFSQDLAKIEAIERVTESDKFTEDFSAINTYFERITEEVDAEIIDKKFNFYQLGSELIEDDHQCPLCGYQWQDIIIQEIIEGKLRESKEIRVLFNAYQTALNNIYENFDQIRKPLQRMATLGKTQNMPEVEEYFQNWHHLINQIEIKKPIEESEFLGYARCLAPDGLSKVVDRLKAFEKEHKNQQSPEQVALRELFVISQLYTDYQKAEYDLNRAEARFQKAEILYQSLNDARDKVLKDLYDEIQGKFVNYYQILHNEDEKNFTANFEHEESSFDIEVDFHDQGLHPPHALHSEGHQDSMGICLFLALNDFFLKNKFQLMIMDDVVMSVDAEHRKAFCQLIQKEFKDQQFIITTHDSVWADQLRTAGVVSRKNTIRFINWDLSTGPMIAESGQVWERIEQLIQDDDIPTAAAILRRELEMQMNLLADYLKVSVIYRMDGRYTLFDFMPQVHSTYIDYLKKALVSAQSWGRQDQFTQINNFKKNLSEVFQRIQIFISDVNSQVHFTHWKQLNRHDFQPIFQDFQLYLQLLRCDNCESFVLVAFEGKSAKFLSCNCGEIHWSLIEKQ